METVGDRIKHFRDSRGLTQKEIYQATHGAIKQTSLSAIEKNQAKPGFDTLAALLQAYPALSSDWLLRGTGPMLHDGLTPVHVVQVEEARPAYTSSKGSPSPEEKLEFHKLLNKELHNKIASLEEQLKESRADRREERQQMRASADNQHAMAQASIAQLERSEGYFRQELHKAQETIVRLEEGLAYFRGQTQPVQQQEPVAQAEARPKEIRGLWRQEPSWGDYDVQAEEGELRLSHSNPDFIRPQDAEQEVSPLKLAA